MLDCTMCMKPPTFECEGPFLAAGTLILPTMCTLLITVQFIFTATLPWLCAPVYIFIVFHRYLFISGLSLTANTSDNVGSTLQRALSLQ